MEGGITFSNIPTGWNEAPLGSILPLNYGKALPERNRDSNGTYFVYGSSGMVGTHSEGLAKGPCLIVGRKGSAGKVFFTDKDCWPIDTVYYSDTRNTDELKYLYYLLYFIRLDKKDNSTAIPSLSRDVYNRIPVPIAPINEQKRIVDKIEQLFSNLDEGESLLKKVQQQLNIYRQSVLKAAVTGELTKDWRETNKHRLESGDALLKRILKARREQCNGRGRYEEPANPDTTDLPLLPDGWVWAKLEQISLVTGGLTKNSKRQNIDLQLPMLRVANVYQNKLLLDEIHTIGINQSELERVSLKKYDILIVEGNGSKDQIGRMAIWNDNIKNCVHQNHLIKSRFIDVQLVDLAIKWFMSPTGRDLIEKVASSTSGLHTLSISKVNELSIPLPSLEEVVEISSQLDTLFSQIDALEQWCASELTRSATLRQSILKDAFTGKLVPQDPNDEPANELLKRIQAERSNTQKVTKYKSPSTTSTRRGRPRKNP